MEQWLHWSDSASIKQAEQRCRTWICLLPLPLWRTSLIYLITKQRLGFLGHRLVLALSIFLGEKFGEKTLFFFFLRVQEKKDLLMEKFKVSWDALSEMSKTETWPMGLWLEGINHWMKATKEERRERSSWTRQLLSHRG